MKKNASNPFHAIPLVSGKAQTVLFEAQPIMAIEGSRVVGHELLYRGTSAAAWPDVDAAVLRYLQTTQDLPLLFVNLSNQGLMEASSDELQVAARKNGVVFELSESVSGYEQHEAIAAKVNALIDQGLRFAIDDFGTGRDSLERVYELAPTAAIKVDRNFLLTCASRADAAKTLSYLVAQWRDAGVWSIAEGIETRDLLQFATSVGVDMVQGWYVDALIYP